MVTPPEGPKLEHLVQAGLYAEGLGAQSVSIVYVDKGSGRVAQWDVGLGEASPHGVPALDGTTLWAEVAFELREVDELCDLLDAGKLAERYWPAAGVIDNPRQQKWPCGYCRHLDTCAALPAVAVSLDELQART